MNGGKYYIYYHIDPRDNLPKYIGKGSGNRAWELGKSRRGKRHYRWIKNLESQDLKPLIFIGKCSNNEDDIYKSYELQSFWRKIGVYIKNIDKGGRKIKNKPKNMQFKKGARPWNKRD